MNIGRERNKIVFIFYCLAVMFFTSLLLEGGVYILYKLGKVELIDSNTLINMTKKQNSPAFDASWQLIPHPYFGYTYKPNSGFFNKTYLESNSEGFIDKEFTMERKGDTIVYGIIGGSAAMSWGVEKREERISYQLEVLLNAYAKKTSSNKRYRILNLGVGSYIQYQATQVFFYYKNLLDGVIIYSGHNEIAHGIILTRDVPVQYPWTDLLRLLKIESPLKYEIYHVRDKLGNYANFLLKRKYLLYSHSLRFFFNRIVETKLKRIDELNKQLKEEADKYSFNMPYIKRDTSQDPAEYIHQNFLQDDAESIAVQKKIIKAIVPLVYTDPVVDVYAVTKARGIHFLNIIQPMMLTVDRKITPEELKETKATPFYEKTGLEIIRTEADKMKKLYGIETYDMNDGQWFRDTKKAVFIDPVHLTPEGNKIVANYLFKLINEEWLNR